ncbi:efflux RND transporter periplasmic adaptor subunit [Natronospira bacteriovora]|uniref:Efflux RND transporter periplasmic adaptor subunit n=1 Tax=Natronospira bacteriovora TaxID=3069753 RepID=A0ABU0WA69_9GAMM|nr:efflux RND transporter periplasmic adaptor subunit [Natronospira sp. AB-CW4]MDQ2070345.1 efflux RND transporter periplasmic adaptor subunit [Natronospira sp. AB-CW4]
MKATTIWRSLVTMMTVLALVLVVACGDNNGHDDHDHHDHDHHQHENDHDHDHGDGEKWYCPMHPEVTDDEPGRCPICGMDLVTDEDDDHAHHGHDHHHQDDNHDHDHDHENGDELWTCPMHPQVERDEPGRCPICGMDLVQRDAHDLDHDQVHVPAGIQQTINVRTTSADRGRLMRHVETVGRVSYDESRLKHIHPRVEGWIQALDVKAEGDRVEAGQRLFTLYSPELVNAQEEFLQALRRGETEVINAARSRLRALDVQSSVIDTIERSREVKQYLPWYAPHDAYVTALGVRYGMYVSPGLEIMELADLSSVWVIADVFESQASWVEVGQHAMIGLPFSPGEQAHSDISHVYPVLDERTRSLRVRLPVDNGNRHLRPGMWTAVSIHAAPSDEGVIIPLEALIRTGRANRVVIREDGEHFRVREVTPGMVSGDRVMIRDGIEAGDEVVVSGHFLIDSEASIRGGHARIEDHANH